MEKILKLLKEHKGIIIVIGATAFPAHGYSRAILDIKIHITYLAEMILL